MQINKQDAKVMEYSIQSAVNTTTIAKEMDEALLRLKSIFSEQFNDPFIEQAFDDSWQNLDERFRTVYANSKLLSIETIKRDLANHPAAVERFASAQLDDEKYWAEIHEDFTDLVTAIDAYESGRMSEFEKTDVYRYAQELEENPELQNPECDLANPYVF